MSDHSADEAGADGLAEGGSGAGRRKKLLPLIAVGAVVLLLAGGAGAYFSGLLGGGGEGEAHTAEAEGGGGAAGHDAKPAADEKPTYYALPDMLVTLNTGDRRSTFLKLKVNVELASAEDSRRIEEVLPRVVDYCQVYLRELRLDEIRGSAGTARLREELMRRIGTAVAPVQVKDVLFSDIFIQ